MVAQVLQKYEEHFEPSVDIYSILGEPEDPKSSWSDLRIAQLQGFDYIYFSSKINTKLACKTALQEFLIDLFQIADSKSDRARVFIYMENSIGTPEFFAFNLSWYGNKIREFKIDTIDNPRNKEFIRTMFEYSSLVMTVAEGE